MPQPDGFNYQRYLASREWALLKRQVKQRSQGRCERCLYGSHQDTHHITYERIGRENLADLQGICRPCHEYLSGVSDHDPATEFVLLPAVCFVRYERHEARDWSAFIQPVGASDSFELPVLADGDGLFAIFAALFNSEKVWHPYLLDGDVLQAFIETEGETQHDAGRPPFIKQLKTCFFPCEGADCDHCRVAVERRV